MKKRLLKLFVTVVSFVLLAVTFTACGGGFNGTSLKDWGKTDGYTNGGFVRETENYVYLINGTGSNKDDNTFGAPIKGSLIAVKKDGFGTDDQKVEIVVPKLFVATDYNAGVYIFGDYVYYATPSTDKDPAGNVVNTSLALSSTKLDGTGTKVYATIAGLSSEYRVVKAGNDVFFVYYDGENSELVSLNTTDGAKTVIAKVDEKADESLDVYKFVDNDAIDQAVVVYTTTVYSEKYDEAQAEAKGDEYSRGKESFNKVYAYKVGEAQGKLVLDGKYSAPDTERVMPLTYTLILTEGEYVAYSQIDVDDIGKKRTYVAKVSDFYAGANLVEVDNASSVASGIIIKALDEVYLVDGTNVVKTTFDGSYVLNEKPVAAVSEGSKIVGVNGDYVYYTSSANVLFRANVVTGDKDSTHRVCEETVNASWYAPEFVTINGKTYVFYLDNSEQDAGYVKYVDVDATVEETVEEGEVTDRFLTGNKLVAIMTDKDIALAATVKINKVSEALTANGNVILDVEEDGKPVAMQAVLDARDVYESLTKDQKKQVSADAVKLIEKLEKAVDASIKLHDLKDFDKATDKDALKDAYESAKKVIESLESTDEGKAVVSAMVENYRWFYQQADKYFNPEEK